MYFQPLPRRILLYILKLNRSLTPPADWFERFMICNVLIGDRSFFVLRVIFFFIIIFLLCNLLDREKITVLCGASCLSIWQHSIRSSSLFFYYYLLFSFMFKCVCHSRTFTIHNRQIKHWDLLLIQKWKKQNKMNLTCMLFDQNQK